MAGVSPAMKLIQHFNKHFGAGMGRSRERDSIAIRSAVQLCIAFGVPFHVNDFVALAKNRVESYYDTSIYRAGEADYALACGGERGRFNVSAAKAYERYRRREPFLFPDANAVTPTRMYVGRRFAWKGEHVTCTSFDRGGKSIVVCSYKMDGSGQRKVKRVHRITREMLLAERRRLSVLTNVHATYKLLGEKQQVEACRWWHVRSGGKNQHEATLEELKESLDAMKVLKAKADTAKAVER